MAGWGGGGALSRGQRSRWGLETGQWDKTEGASAEKDPYPAWGLAPSTRAFVLKVIIHASDTLSVPWII